jgi:RND family efflux transporter MFP subunit
MIPVWAGAAATGCQPAPSMRKPPAPVAVYDLPVTREVIDYEEFPGSTEAIVSVQVRARVSGYMNRQYFKDGDVVQEGDKLFQIDPRQYIAEFERAEGNVQQIEAHKRRLDREYHRAKNLLARKSMSTEDTERYEFDFRETEANLRLAMANRDLARLNLDWCEVRAPATGLLSRRMVDPGNLIKADDTVLTSIVSLDPIYVYFDVHEQAMLRISRLIQEGKIQVKAQGTKEVPVEIALSDEKDFPHEGLVNFTDNRVDINTGTLRFRAKIDNPVDRYGNRFIVPGLFVRVRLRIGNPHPALMIREQSLVSDQGQRGVFIITDKDDKGQPLLDEQKNPIEVAIWKRVGTPGVLSDGFREINEGIKLGDRVVVSGHQRLRNGREVKAERYIETVSSQSASATGATPAPPSRPRDQAKPAAAPAPDRRRADTKPPAASPPASPAPAAVSDRTDPSRRPS